MTNIPMTKEEEEAYVDLVSMVQREISTISIDDEYKQYHHNELQRYPKPFHDNTKSTFSTMGLALCIGFPSFIFVLFLSGKNNKN